MNRIRPMTPMRRRRSPLLIPAILLVAAIAAIVALAQIDASKPLKPVEKVVPQSALAK